MADRDKDTLTFCLEQQEKGDVKLYGQELLSQALSEGPITMEAAQSEKTSGTEEAQKKGEQDLDPTHHRRKQMELELLQPKMQAEKDLMQSTPSIPTTLL